MFEDIWRCDSRPLGCAMQGGSFVHGPVSASDIWRVLLFTHTHTHISVLIGAYVRILENRLEFRTSCALTSLPCPEKP